MAELGRARRGPVAGGTGRLRAARGSRVMVTICAWCGARAVGEIWSGRITRPDVLAALDRAGVLTHGICPACFDAEAPNHAYPRRAS
jgi:hypothetical protein